MSLTVSSKPAMNIKPVEAGTHMAVCYGLVDIGHQYNEKYKKSTHKVIVMFELLDETITTKDGNEINRTMSSRYTMSLSEKAVLYKDLISWRGQPFTDDELKGFNLRNIVGAPCLLSVVRTERNGTTYANISGIMKMPKSMSAAVVPTLDKIIFDLDESDLSKMDELPKWIQELIKASDEYKERFAGMGHGADPEADVSEGAAQYGAFTELDGDEKGFPF